MNFEKTKELTAKYSKAPKAGMRFHEMYTHWVYVIAVVPIPFGKVIVVREFSGHPANPPADCIKYHVFKSGKEFEDCVKYTLFCDNKAFECMRKETYATAADLGFK